MQVDIPAIAKQRKHLAKQTLDMDSARSRYMSVVKQNHTGNASAAKTDTLRDEMEEASHRVEQCRVSEKFWSESGEKAGRVKPLFSAHWNDTAWSPGTFDPRRHTEHPDWPPPVSLFANHPCCALMAVPGPALGP